MSWLSSKLKSARKAVGLPPITFGTVAKVGAVAAATAVGGPGAGAAVTAGLGALSKKGWSETAQEVWTDLKESTQITVDPLTNSVGISTGASLDLGDALGGTAGGLGAHISLPWYYYAAGGLLVWFAIKGAAS
jgi:hypothetical protein